MKIDEEFTQSSLHKVFVSLPDPRKQRNQQYPAINIITIAICAILCGADDWIAVAMFGEARRPFFDKILDLSSGIPSHDTFNRFFRFLDPAVFEKHFAKWTSLVAKLTKGRIIAIDGKVLCNSTARDTDRKAFDVVGAYLDENELILGQLAVEEKSNEITAIPLLLEMIDIRGATVTIDAIGCQKDIAKTIKDEGGDYILALKGNHSTLHSEVQNFFQQALKARFEGVTYDLFHSEERSRGRIERRAVYVCDGLEWLGQLPKWEGLRSLVWVYSEREVNGKLTTESRYYISSHEADAQLIANAVRSHWSIENKVHWVLDVAFLEDKCKIRKDHGPENFSIARRLTTNLLRLGKKVKAGIKNRRLLAGWDDNYLWKVLTSSDN